MQQLDNQTQTAPSAEQLLLVGFLNNVGFKWWPSYKIGKMQRLSIIFVKLDKQLVNVNVFVTGQQYQAASWAPASILISLPV